MAVPVVSIRIRETLVEDADTDATSGALEAGVREKDSRKVLLRFGPVKAGCLTTATAPAIRWKACGDTVNVKCPQKCATDIGCSRSFLNFARFDYCLAGGFGGGIRVAGEKINRHIEISRKLGIPCLKRMEASLCMSVRKVFVY